MYRFWDTIIKPVLDIMRPGTILEIGSDRGLTTQNLLEFCQKHNAKLHVIDPLPKYDVSEWGKKFSNHLVFHLSLSLDALSQIDQFDVVLIDGDHNWYTVINELKLIEKRSHELGLPFPLIMLHDIGWPYGRRDLYYNPENIPEAFRKPYKQMGIKHGSAELVETGGLNPHLYNAIDENDSQNGVLSAVEDFLKVTENNIELVKIQGIYGLGILIPMLLMEQNKDLKNFINSLKLSPFAKSFIEHIENDRIEELILRQEQSTAVQKPKIDMVSMENPISEASALVEHYIKILKQKDQDLSKANSMLIQKDQDLYKPYDKWMEIERLINKQSQDIDTLSNWMEKLNVGITTILMSRRWKVGKFIGDIYRRMLFKPSVPTPTEYLDQINDKHQKWKLCYDTREHKNSPTQISEVRTSTCVVPFENHSGEVIVCIHNATKDVIKCLNSVERHTDLSHHKLILIDDGSNDETHHIVKEYATRIDCTHIRNKEPRGYTRAANQGIEASSGSFVVLLNSDTIVTSGWIEKLIKCAFSTDSIACVGPLSNAASWQSIPELMDEKGTWKINSLPQNVTLDMYAENISFHSPRLYPTVPLVNGFCYMITRDALKKVGLFDEESFPVGYGEEDDFSIRSLDAGFKHRIADDCFVYHAKSKSFTSTRRNNIVSHSKQFLSNKHGLPRIRNLINQLQNNEELLKARVAARMAGNHNGHHVTRDFSSNPLTIGWIQPHLKTVGGIRRTIEMTNRLVQWHHKVILLTPSGKKSSWLPIKADIASLSAINSFTFDVLIASDPDIIEPFLETDALLKINYHLAAYNIYRNPSDNLTAYYNMNKDVLQIANSHWTAEQVKNYYQIKTILPGGIDRNLFRPTRTRVEYDVVCHGSKRPHKGTETIINATRGLKLLSLADINADQNDLSRLISSAKIFASGCWHEGFSFCPLEAMACGIPVVMTDDGGSREYAKNEENALIVEPCNEKDFADAVSRLMDDMPLRLKLIENGMETAWQYSWDRVSANLADLIQQNVSMRKY